MAYLACSCRLSHDGDDVETDVETDAVPFDIGIGCEGERSHFLWCDGLVGIGELLVLPCLHLGDDKHAVVYRNGMPCVFPLSGGVDPAPVQAVLPVCLESGVRLHPCYLFESVAPAQIGYIIIYSTKLG